ncbi:hypothetical protein Bra3105_06695 [Brachybacterium halotolerans subsp. kimchii]|uniref:hypothetical protein n=1 Tax=Brachybacterium halotolerans TaxID=2795215 RepID=UPI001E4E23CD|nr:hypothetical protein [Brachybacterium halotolerans]UEJ83995.1 hypothetical protein Bra3105_06695 [Brachybacterium halotolerans subsp. kimchii]
MTARIYREDGSWWSIQPDPSGGEIRCRYPDGRAAMVALDPRNRERVLSPARYWMDAYRRLGGGYHRGTDYQLGGPVPQQYSPGQCPPSNTTTKDCE